MISKQETVKINSLANIMCIKLHGVGQALSERLAKLGIYTVQDILFHLPTQYQDRTRLVPLGNVRPGKYALIQGEILSTQVINKRRRMLLCRIFDGVGSITLCFFHFYPSQQRQLTKGKHLRCFGEVRYWQGSFAMIHPEYSVVVGDEPLAVDEHLTPIYPTTDGITQITWRKLTSQALQYLNDDSLLADYLPDKFSKQFHVDSIAAALGYIHRPPPDANVALLQEGKHPAQQRLALEELLAHHLYLKQLRNQVKQFAAPPLKRQPELLDKFLQQLAFTLTQAQQRVISEISADLTTKQAMMRLVQGDVGSGKTVVAAMAAIQAISNGYQVMLMAPTELLAEQHYQSFKQWLQPLNINLGWLAGSLKGKARKAMLETIANGTAQLIIGTHALFQQQVGFEKVGLIIVDEQHRFGVEQRLALRGKGAIDGLCPHQLIMTATPIPRTLAMTVYADLDNSIIDELPPGRKPVDTVVINNEKRQAVMERIQQHCETGQQVYWVCTLISESETLQAETAEDTVQLMKNHLPGLRIGLIHGRLKPVEKDQIMAGFKAGELDLLVATTVIEVGVDVPNASLMVIENAERLGLAQLHQLRGRVGRGQQQSYCVLLYQAPLSEYARSRLKVMRETNDGFAIAKRDLELRGPGEVLGTKQTGLARMKIADLIRDQHLLAIVQQHADEIVKANPQICELLWQRWLEQGKEYVNV